MTEMRDIEKEIEKLAAVISSLYQTRSLYLFKSSKWCETELQILNETSKWRSLKEKLVMTKLSC